MIDPRDFDARLEGACGANPPPPDGYRYMRDPVPHEVSRWSKVLRDQVRLFPIFSLWTMPHPRTGQEIVARSEWHTWSYVDGARREGLCIPGISVFEPAP